MYQTRLQAFVLTQQVQTLGLHTGAITVIQKA